MSFNSYAFTWVFLPVVLIMWWALKEQRLRLFVLLAANIVFYAWNSGAALALLLLSVWINFSVASTLGRKASNLTRRALLVAVLLFDIGVLGCFKFSGVCISMLTATGAVRLSELAETFLKGVGGMPLGVSFYTFTLISYVVDVYRKTVVPQSNLATFAVYATAFPTIVSGPILRYAPIRSQLATFCQWEPSVAYRGVALFVLGMAKKILIADVLVGDVDRLFNDAAGLHLLGAWLAGLLFSVQLYFDFSGYSDMAMGIGHLLGIRIPPNFDSPYRASSIAEFWRRWHISLSQWLRDYVFMAIGGSSVRLSRTVSRVMVTMLVCGVWHGSGWTFLAWGAYHGVVSSIHGVMRSWDIQVRQRWLAVAGTFAIVLIGWVIFRSASLEQAAGILGAMVGARGTESLAEAIGLISAKHALLLLGAAGFCLLAQEIWRNKFESSALGALALAIILFACSAKFSSGSQFVYFQF